MSALRTLCLVAVLVAASCSRRPPVTSGPSELVGEGVRVARIAPSGLPPGPALSGRPGDFSIEADRVRAVVGSGGEGPEAAAMHGAILDASGVEWQADLLRELRVVARVAGSDVPLRTIAVEPVAGKGAPRLVIVQRGGGNARGLELRTELGAARGRPWLELVTRAKNAGSTTLSGFRVGDRLRWLRQPPFLPGLGTVQRAPHQLTRWFAISSARQSYALVFTDGPAEVSSLPLEDSSEQLALAPPVELVPGAEIVFKRAMVIAAGGVAAVAEHAFTLTGEKIGRVAGRIEPAPAWARLEARSQADELTLAVDIGADGAFDFALPQGNWKIVLRAPGGRDEARVTVTAGAVARPEFIVPTPSTLAFRVTDSQNRPLAARLVVRGIPPTPDPDLGPPHQASGAKTAAYTVSGVGSLPLPPGRYDVLVTHGIEYTIERQSIELGAESGATLRARLDRAVETPGEIACDFHLHASPSGDSNVPLPDRVASLLAEGIELAVATDHNHVTDYGPAVEALGARARLATARGVEITTPRWGHFNAFPLPEGASPPAYADVAPIAIFEAVRSTAPGAVIQVNHPRMPNDIGYFAVAALGADAGPAEGFSYDFDTIEVFNGFDLPNLPLVERNIQEWFSLLASGRSYTAVGNSDSHDLARQHAGYPRTYVRVNDDRPEAVRAEAVAEALKAGRAFVTSGPMIELVVAGGRPGDLVRASGGRVSLDITVRAAPWIDVSRVVVVVSGQPRHEQIIAPSEKPERHRLHAELALAEDAFIVAIVRGDKPLDAVLPTANTRPLAFTNPVYVDVDGDGAFGTRRR